MNRSKRSGPSSWHRIGTETTTTFCSMTDEVLAGRLTIGCAWAAGDAPMVEKVCNEMDVDLLNAVVTGTVFAMAAGESGIPAWLRTAERVLDARR